MILPRTTWGSERFAVKETDEVAYLTICSYVGYTPLNFSVSSVEVTFKKSHKI